MSNTTRTVEIRLQPTELKAAILEYLAKDPEFENETKTLVLHRFLFEDIGSSDMALRTVCTAVFVRDSYSK